MKYVVLFLVALSLSACFVPVGHGGGRGDFHDTRFDHR
jgi:hypothetical protein